MDQDRLVSYVTGVPVDEAETGEPFRGDLGAVALEVKGLAGPALHGVDLTIHAGEVVGVAGVLGSGREALPAMLFGSIPSEAETFAVQGKDYPRRNPRESIRRGMGVVPGDRAHFGPVRPMTARENVTLPELKSLTGPLGAISASRERAHATELMAKYDVKPQIGRAHV